MATPDPYQSWSGAPKHWVHVPAQRNGPPGPDQLDAAASGQSGGKEARGGWAVAAIAIAVAVVAVVLVGTGSAESDGPPPEKPTSGTFLR